MPDLGQTSWMKERLGSGLSGSVGQQAPVCPGGRIYRVRAGDTLFRIAQRFGVSVDAILQANPQITNPDVLRVGQSICIPGVTPPGPPCPGGRIYIIRPGDTFFAIAQRFGVSVADLIAANPGVDPDRLVVGQRICIPGRPPVPPPPPPPPRGRGCTPLSPTDLVPRSLGVVGLDFNRNRVVVAVDGLPAPGQIAPGADLWRAWFRLRTTADWVPVDLANCNGVWAGAGDIVDLFLYGPVRVTAEPAGQVARPMGPAGAEGTIQAVRTFDAEE
ncbi:LysM peptidoglycan-binding domain-containing protein [Limnochorda pilosa]|nr:LysM peptidoglycan-binding domain-containing protein [Limnochorda pilosa]